MAQVHYFRAAWIIAIGSIVLPAPSLAATKTYIGDAGQGTWSVNSLWSPTGAPQNGDNCFLTPSDSNNRTVVFNGPGFGVFNYGAVTVQSGGTGSITLLNNATFPFTAQFPAQSLTVGAGGIFRQNPGTTCTIGSTTINNNGTIINDNGTYFATDVTQAGGFVFGGAWVISNRYSLQSGQVQFLSGQPLPHITNNGTFEQSASTVMHCTMTNNGTFIYNGGLVSFSSIENHGTIIPSADLQLSSLNNFVSMSMPAGLKLTAFGGITQSAATLTQSNNVTAELRIAGGTWHQLGGILTSFSGGGTLMGGTVIVGANGSPGTFLFNDGVISKGPILIGGADSTGTFLQSGGTLQATQPISVGATPENFGPGGRGFYSISGGNITAPSLVVGATDALAGTFLQSGGVVSVSSLTINQNLTSSATVSITGGTFNCFGGVVNNDTFLQSGGVSSLRRIDGAGRVSVTGNASLSAEHGIRQESVQLAGNGRINTTQAAPTPTNRVRALSFEQTGADVHGTWDIGQGPLIVDYTGASPIADIRRYLRSGYAGGSWNGTGLTSSTARFNSGTTALGYGEASELLGPGGGVFQGALVDGTAVLVRLTRPGDADLDGDADGVDIGTWALNFTGELGVAGTKVWTEGDWDYDGDVDGVDAGLWATSFTGELGGGGLSSVVINDWPPSREAAEILQGLGVSVVPEPAALSILFGAAWSLRRRPASVRNRIRRVQEHAAVARPLVWIDNSRSSTSVHVQFRFREVNICQGQTHPVGPSCATESYWPR